MAADIAGLQDQLRGDVVTADDEGWDEARAAWNLLIDQRPALVALPADAEDVATIVRWASDAALRVTAQTTGHRAGTIGDLSGTVLIKTERMAEVRVDAEARTVWAAAGVTWDKVVGAVAPHELAVLSGTAGSVGVAGFVLGGGIGWLSREYGLSSNHVCAIDVVTADGRLRTVDADHDPDLFWALRGGGGDFGIVTGIEMETVGLGGLFGGSYFWPVERAPEVFAAWAPWSQAVPRELSSCARFFNFPPLPFIPEPFRGRSLVSVEVVFHGPTDRGRELVQPFVDLRPEMGGCDEMPTSALLTLHQDPPNPGPSVGDGVLIARFDPEAQAAFCQAAMDDAGRRLVSIEVRQLAGALAETPDGAGVLATLPGEYAVYAAGVASPGADPAALHDSVDGVRRALSTVATAHGYTNFSHQPGDLSAFFSPAEITRLREVKDRYDPSDIIRGTNPLPAA